MANDDWRITIEVEKAEHATGFLERLTSGLGDEARDLAKDLEAHRLAVSRDDNTIFVYAASQAAAEQARAVIEAELRYHGLEASLSPVEHWLDEEDRWDDEPPGETWEEEELDRGYAPWEVRVECASREAANELADQLETEGYRPQRRSHFLIVGAASREDADVLAARVHGEVEPGGELVYEVEPTNPFSIFGGLGM